MKENEDDLERILAELIAQNAELEVCYILFSIPVFLKFTVYLLTKCIQH